MIDLSVLHDDILNNIKHKYRLVSKLYKLISNHIRSFNNPTHAILNYLYFRYDVLDSHYIELSLHDLIILAIQFSSDLTFLFPDWKCFDQPHPLLKQQKSRIVLLRHTLYGHINELYRIQFCFFKKSHDRRLWDYFELSQDPYIQSLPYKLWLPDSCFKFHTFNRLGHRELYILINNVDLNTIKRVHTKKLKNVTYLQDQEEFFIYCVSDKDVHKYGFKPVLYDEKYKECLLLISKKNKYKFWIEADFFLELWLLKSFELTYAH